MLSVKQFNYRIPEFLRKLKGRSNVKLFLTLLIGVSLLFTTLLVLGAGKTRTPEIKTKQSLKCPPNGYAKKILPLNRSKIPSPPVPAKFLGLSRATFAASSNLFNIPLGQQWCWGSTCSHIALQCYEGSIGGGPCCYNC